MYIHTCSSLIWTTQICMPLQRVWQISSLALMWPRPELSHQRVAPSHGWSSLPPWPQSGAAPLCSPAEITDWLNAAERSWAWCGIIWKYASSWQFFRRSAVQWVIRGDPWLSTYRAALGASPGVDTLNENLFVVEEYNWRSPLSGGGGGLWFAALLFSHCALAFETLGSSAER